MRTLRHRSPRRCPLDSMNLFVRRLQGTTGRRAAQRMCMYMYVRRLPAVGLARAAGSCPGPGRFRVRLSRRGHVSENGAVTVLLSFAICSRIWYRDDVVELRRYMSRGLLIIRSGIARLFVGFHARYCNDAIIDTSLAGQRAVIYDSSFLHWPLVKRHVQTNPSMEAKLPVQRLLLVTSEVAAPS